MSGVSLRPYQALGVNGIRQSFGAGNKAVVYVLPTGGGKCLKSGTKIIKYSGDVVNVEDVKTGDLLMGPDSLPRTVVSTCTGREMMYRITPTKGDPYTVNESHILSLKLTNFEGRVTAGDGKKYEAGDIVNINVLDYLKSSNTFKHVAKGWRTGVDFDTNRKPLEIPPYILGAWLGDGTTNYRIELTNPDEEVISEWYSFASNVGCRVSTREQDKTDCKGYVLVSDDRNGRNGGSNPALNKFRDLDLMGNKHIPHKYKTATRKDRLALLAGIIDTDGYLHHNGYDIVLKHERLMNDVAFVARSLGFACYIAPCKKICTNTGAKGDYFRMNITGDVDEIPCKVPRRKAQTRKQKKSVLMTGITVEPVGEGDYYGFELSGPDRLFLLGDFTVTHNTFTFAYIANAASMKGNRVLILVHRKELLMQASMSLAKIGLRHTLVCQDKHFREIQIQHMRELKYSAIDQMSNVCIASTGTLINRLSKIMTPQLIICDEAHHCIDGNTWGKIVSHFNDSRLLGVTATPIRVDGKGLGRHAGGMFDDMIVGPSMNELIGMGNLTPIRLFCPPTELDLSGVKRSNGDFQRKDIEERVDKPKITGSAVEHYGKICPGAPTIAFCVSVDHAEHTAAQFRAGGFKFHSIDGSMHDAERRNLIHQLATGGIHGLTSCDIISEGTDIPVVTCGIMLRPTDSTGLYMQQGGRTLRPAPEIGKDAAIILDHVGNTMRHGLLNEDREWSLDGVKKKKNKNGEDTYSVKTMQCSNCYAVFSPAHQCPECGTPVEFRGRTVEEVAGSLKETTEAEIKAARKIRNYEDSQALTFNDLLELGKQRGYKNPAAWARFKINGRKDNETRR